MADTILCRLEKIPPFVCRLIARKSNGRRGLSNSEIAKASGLTLSTVRVLSFATTFRGHAIETCEKFALACGVNHLAAERSLEFIRRRKWTHTERAGGSQRRMYDRLKRLLVSEARRRATLQADSQRA